MRAKNVKNILLKNMLDSCISALFWWGIGSGAAFGDSGSPSGNVFIGTATQGPQGFFAAGWGSVESQADGYTMARWMFQYGFAAAASTIVSGAVAERAPAQA